MNFSPAARRILLFSGAIAGTAAAVDISRFLLNKGTVDGEGQYKGTVTGRILGNRHVIGFAVSQLFHPGRLGEARQSAADARTAESLIFHDGNLKKHGVDTPADAFRHTYASALLTYRLVAEHGMSIPAAKDFTEAVTGANENDSHSTGAHGRLARQMDEHNNEVGVSIGARAAHNIGGLSEGELQQRVLRAMSEGQTLVFSDDNSLRTTTRRDVAG